MLIPYKNPALQKNKKKKLRWCFPMMEHNPNRETNVEETILSGKPKVKLYGRKRLMVPQDQRTKEMGDLGGRKQSVLLGAHTYNRRK